METGKDCLHIMSCKNDDDCELSVVVRVYNSSGTLRKCLEAIRVSDFNDYELIVIDDASTDSSADIAREYADKERGLGFFLFAVPITFLDHLVMASGITLGFLSTIMKRRNNVV